VDEKRNCPTALGDGTGIEFQQNVLKGLWNIRNSPVLLCVNEALLWINMAGNRNLSVTLM
jgi:hypothetical protein